MREGLEPPRDLVSQGKGPEKHFPRARCFPHLPALVQPPSPQVPPPPIPIPRPWLLAFDVVVQGQRRHLLQMINLLPLGNPRPVCKKGDREGQVGSGVRPQCRMGVGWV